MDEEEQKQPNMVTSITDEDKAKMRLSSSEANTAKSESKETEEAPTEITSRDNSKIRASAACLDRNSGTLDNLGMNSRLMRELGLVRSPIEQILASRNQLTGVTSAIDAAQKSIAATGAIGRVLSQQQDMMSAMHDLGGLNMLSAKYSAMNKAIAAMGGMGPILKHHNEMNRIAIGSLGPLEAGYPTSAAFLATKSLHQAMRDIAGITSFTRLLGHGGEYRATLDALVSSTQRWREATGGLSLTASLRAQLPDLIPELRRVTASDIAGATLSSLGERYAENGARFALLQKEMLGLQRPWVDVSNPSQSVAAYVDARALATIVAEGPPESRAVVSAVREELGDFRETKPVDELVAADPMLRSALRLEVGFNPNLSSLPPAIIATVFSSYGGNLPRNIEADPDALESAVHQRARRLELKLRRFIERKMNAAAGAKWSKQRVRGEVCQRWRQRRQLDIDNGRRASRLFDYAGFEDYREIIEHKQNWEEVFKPVFKVKTSILETLRRLSLIRNPDAHYRIVTIEDFLDLHTEGRRLDAWMDGAD